MVQVRRYLEKMFVKIKKTVLYYNHGRNREKKAGGEVPGKVPEENPLEKRLSVFSLP